MTNDEIADAIVKIDQYMRDDTVRWHAVHARISAVTTLLSAVFEFASQRDLRLAREFMDLAQRYRDQAEEADVHPAGVQEFQRFLDLAKTWVRPVPVPTTAPTKE